MTDVEFFDRDDLKSRLCRGSVRPIMRQRSGFTLIELMIVIAIIAIIAAIAIPNLIEARKAGNEASAIGSLRTINVAQALYVERERETTYGTLDQLREENLINPVLAGGAKQGYYIQVESTGSDSMRATAVPATASAGSQNYISDCESCCGDTVLCTIRQSSSGLPDSTSPIVPANEGNPADPVPPTSPPSGCVASPSGFTPTTHELQAASDAQISMFLRSMAVAMVEAFDPSLASLAFNLFANAPAGGAGPVGPAQAVVESLDHDGNGELDFGEVGPEAFSGAAVIAGVVNTYGSCVNACVAAGETGSSCETTCSEFVAPDGEVVGMLDGMVGALPFMLEIGIACEEDLPSLPLSAFSGNPLAFVSAAFGLGPAVPMLAPPVLGVLAISLSVVGLRRSRDPADRTSSPRS